jgi:hypothetical protein
MVAGRGPSPNSASKPGRNLCLRSQGLAEGMKRGERADHGWLLHMAAKEWVDQDDFASAWMVAQALHGIRGIDPKLIREQISDMPIHRDWDALEAERA